MSTSHYLGDYTALCRTSFGSKMFLDTRDLSLAPHILLGETWESWITSAITPLLRGAHFIDVGANIGWFTLLALKNGAASVQSFEPNERLASLISRSVSVNGNSDICAVHNVALGEFEGVASLGYDWDMQGGASILAENRGESEEVEVLPFDHFKDQIPPGSVIMKFDVEGYEPRAVLGAREFITERSPLLFVEYHSDPNNENRLQAMLDFLQQLQYTVSHVRYDGKIHPISYNDITTSVEEAGMLCFARAHR